MKTDTLTSESTVKTTSHEKRYSDTVRHGELRSDRCSWFINEFFLQLIILHLPQARLLYQPQLCPATVRLEKGKI